MLATDTKQTCEVKILKDGQAVDVLVEGIAAQDRQGQERLCRAAVIDISQQKRADELAAANQALEAEIAARKQAEESSANHLATLLRSFSPACIPAVMLVTDEGRVEFANQALCDSFGLDELPADLVGLDPVR